MTLFTSSKTLAAGGPQAGWKPLTLIVASALWIAGVGNLALWQSLHRLGVLGGWRGAGFALGLGVGIAALVTLLLALAAWRHTLKPALLAMLLATGFGAHFMLAYGIVIDSTMITNVAQTNLRESTDLFSLRLLATVGLVGVLPAVLALRAPVAWGRWTQRLRANLLLALAALGVFALAVVASFQPLSSTLRNHKQVRYLINPLNSLVAVGQVAAQPLRAGPRPLQPLGEDARLATARATSRPPLLVLVLGETARSDHFALNGYGRATTPELAALGVASQRNAWSCGTSTAASVPCMFSHWSRSEFDSRSAEHETLVDVLQRAGLAVLWVDNQAGCKGVCDRVPNVSTSALTHPTLCRDGECWDEIMLDGLEARLEALPAERRARGIVVVMHQMGSHGPAYHKRTPPAFKRFTPECTSAALQDCAREEVVNAYDNTIAYTDHFLAATIRWLQGRAGGADTALLYVSDHGESLGENNLYLHGLPYALAPDVQKRVPWITWVSPGFAQRSGVGDACLRQRLDEPLSHDHYFHSVLGLLDVQTSAYRPERDFYRACRQP